VCCTYHSSSQIITFAFYTTITHQLIISVCFPLRFTTWLREFNLTTSSTSQKQQKARRKVNKQAHEHRAPTV
jgi:hypothetical protein